MLLPDEPYEFKDKDIEELKKVLPAGLARRVMIVSGRDLHWYGVHMVNGLSNLAAKLARLRAALQIPLTEPRIASPSNALPRRFWVEGESAMEGKLVRIRAYERSDLDSLMTWVNDEEVTRNLGAPMIYPLSRAAEENYLK